MANEDGQTLDVLWQAPIVDPNNTRAVYKASRVEN
jgi:hypothetical protein